MKFTNDIQKNPLRKNKNYVLQRLQPLHPSEVFLKSSLRIWVLNCLRLAADLSLCDNLLQSLRPRYRIECFPHLSAVNCKCGFGKKHVTNSPGAQIMFNFIH